jgi:hypothetical protein
MKNKLYLIPLIILVFFVSGKEAFSDDDWNTSVDQFNKADYGKIISEKDYNDALKTIEKYSKKDKKRKKVEKKGNKKTGTKLFDKEKEPPLAYDIPQKTDPLITLPVQITYNGKQIEQGFYMVDYMVQGTKYFIRLSQAGKITADIKASIIKNQGIIAEIPSASVNFLDENKLKLVYKCKNFYLEAFLPVCSKEEY